MCAADSTIARAFGESGNCTLFEYGEKAELKSPLENRTARMVCELCAHCAGVNPSGHYSARHNRFARAIVADRRQGDDRVFGATLRANNIAVGGLTLHQRITCHRRQRLIDPDLFVPMQHISTAAHSSIDIHRLLRGRRGEVH